MRLLKFMIKLALYQQNPVVPYYFPFLIKYTFTLLLLNLLPSGCDETRYGVHVKQHLSRQKCTYGLSRCYNAFFIRFPFFFYLIKVKIHHRNVGIQTGLNERNAIKCDYFNQERYRIWCYSWTLWSRPDLTCFASLFNTHMLIHFFMQGKTK